MNNIDIIRFRTKNDLDQKQLGILFGMTQPEISRLETEVRKMTRIHVAHLGALMVISEAGLLADFLAKRTKNVQKGKGKPT